MTEVTIGIGGAAGDGLDKTGDTLAKTAARLGLYVYAYNSYQSVIRGGHIWLRVRLGQEKITSHGDRVDALIAATAMVHGLTVVARNVAGFEPTGVALLNPWLP